MKKWGSVIMCVLLAFIIMCKGVFLVEAKEEAEKVYVAGASDSFPIEFYDHKEQKYKGMIPLLLEQMNRQESISLSIYIQVR